MVVEAVAPQTDLQDKLAPVEVVVDVAELVQVPGVWHHMEHKVQQAVPVAVEQTVQVVAVVPVLLVLMV
jgi:hypothetical protein